MDLDETLAYVRSQRWYETDTESILMAVLMHHVLEVRDLGGKLAKTILAEFQECMKQGPPEPEVKS
jgi:hypothetical protein